MLTRMVLFIIFTVYLVALGFLLSAISLDVQGIGFNTTQKDIPITVYTWNLPSNIEILPIWFNFIFIIVPSVSWVIILVSLFFPTGNAGS